MIDQTLYKTGTQTNPIAYLFFVLRMIEALKFAHEWEHRCSGAGGRHWVKTYCEFLFKQGLDTDVSSAKPKKTRKEMKEMKSDFIKRHAETVIARSQLLTLYHTVRHLSPLACNPLIKSSSARDYSSTEYGARPSGRSARSAPPRSPS